MIPPLDFKWPLSVTVTPSLFPPLVVHLALFSYKIKSPHLCSGGAQMTSMPLASVSCTCSASHGYPAQGCWLPTMMTAEANWPVSIISYILGTLLIGHVRTSDYDKAWRDSVELNLIPLRHHFFSTSAEGWTETSSREICSKSQIRSEVKAPPQFLVFPSSYLHASSLWAHGLYSRFERQCHKG